MTRYTAIELPADLTLDDLARVARELCCTVRIHGPVIRLVPLSRRPDPAGSVRFLPVAPDSPEAA